jgi:hypothetical protein
VYAVYSSNPNPNAFYEETSTFPFYSVRPLPKKTISDIRIAKFEPRQNFFDDRSALNDILNNFSYDLHEFIKTQKGSKYYFIIN